MSCKISTLVLGLAAFSSLCFAETETSNSCGCSSNDAHCFDWFLNTKASHGRFSNSYAFGPKNSSMIVANPYVSFGRFSLEGDFSYGRSHKFAGYIKSPVCMSKITSNLPEFFENYRSIRSGVQKGFENTMDKPHFYRNYARAMYNCEGKNIKVIAGDVSAKNTIGFQSAISGGGINIFRQSGNGSVINPGLPLVITSLSKVEVRLGDEILRVKILEPGTYSMDALGEEAKLPGAKIKISDQVGRSETIKIDYFGGYGMPELGQDDFDITVAFAHHYDVDDPYKMRYKNKPHYSANYRKTVVENLTVGVGGQAYDNSYSMDLTTIFATKFGKISPTISFMDTYKGEKALAFGLYYAIPENKYGIHWETNFAVKDRGYGDLNKSKEDAEYYDYYMNKYFATAAANHNLINGSSLPENSRSIMTRLYSDPIHGFVPAFIFRGEWANNREASTKRLREYSVSLTKSFLNCCTVTAMAGLTYDDPSKGRNQESPDRRLTLAFCMNLGSEVTARATYSHMDGERRRKFGSLTYTPEKIPGLEIATEYTRTPGKSIPYVSVKYAGKYGEIKADETVTCNYEDKRAGTRTNHSNMQLFIAGTCLTKSGLSGVKKNNFNVIRTANDFRK